MLSWSSTESGAPAGVEAIVVGDGADAIEFGDELLAFTSAIAGTDDDALALARARLIAVAGPSAMVDAAAVAANFEMMTRLADGTGARFPADVVAQRREMVDRLGISSFTTAR